jgi:hypothetical protein
VSRSKRVRISPYVVLRREQERLTQCGTEKGSPVSAYQNNSGSMKGWSAIFSGLPIGTTAPGRISFFTLPAWESSIGSTARRSHIRSHVVTEVRHEL